MQGAQDVQRACTGFGAQSKLHILRRFIWWNASQSARLWDVRVLLLLFHAPARTATPRHNRSCCVSSQGNWKNEITLRSGRPPGLQLIQHHPCRQQPAPDCLSMCQLQPCQLPHHLQHGTVLNDVSTVDTSCFRQSRCGPQPCGRGLRHRCTRAVHTRAYAQPAERCTRGGSRSTPHLASPMHTN